MKAFVLAGALFAAAAHADRGPVWGPPPVASPERTITLEDGWPMSLCDQPAFVQHTDSNTFVVSCVFPGSPIRKHMTIDRCPKPVLIPTSPGSYRLTC